MRRVLAGTLTGLAGLILGLFILNSPALAGSCASGATCTFDFSDTNVSQTDGQVTIRVVWDNTGATTVLTVSLLSETLTNNPLGIDQFGYNSATLVSGCPTGWICNPSNDPSQMDGFGLFASTAANSGGTDLTGIQFTLASLITNIPDNNTGAEFAAHIRFDGSCSAFIGDSNIPATGSDANCVGGGGSPGGTPGGKIPEPSALILLGSGLLLIGGLGRKFRRKK